MAEVDPRKKILTWGVEDWVSVANVVGFERDVRPAATELELRKATLAHVSEMLSEGLVLIGELAPRFIAWDVTTHEAVTFLESRWTVGSDEPDPTWGWWLDLTPAGRAIGEELYAALPHPEGR